MLSFCLIYFRDRIRNKIVFVELELKRYSTSKGFKMLSVGLSPDSDSDEDVTTPKSPLIARAFSVLLVAPEKRGWSFQLLMEIIKINYIII